MTVEQVIARIIARGRTVRVETNSPHSKYPQCDIALVTDRGTWHVKVGKSGNVADVSFGSYHGVAGSGLTSVETAAIYGDLYLAGKPSEAEKAIAALLATPALIDQNTRERASVPTPAL
jgi:hypothetical protein